MFKKLLVNWLVPFSQIFGWLTWFILVRPIISSYLLLFYQIILILFQNPTNTLIKSTIPIKYGSNLSAFIPTPVSDIENRSFFNITFTFPLLLLYLIAFDIKLSTTLVIFITSTNSLYSSSSSSN